MGWLCQRVGDKEVEEAKEWLWILLHGSTWCPGAEFKSIMAVAASMSDSGRGENMHDGQSWDVKAWQNGISNRTGRTGFFH